MLKVLPIRPVQRKVPFLRIVPVIKVCENHLGFGCHAGGRIAIHLMGAHFILNSIDQVWKHATSLREEGHLLLFDKIVRQIVTELDPVSCFLNLIQSAGNQRAELLSRVAARSGARWELTLPSHCSASDLTLRHSRRISEPSMLDRTVNS